MDRVQVLKRESAELGGDPADEVPYDSPIEPNEDAIEAAGVYLQDASHRDETTLVARNGDDMTFKDVSNTTPVTLTELISGTGGLTKDAHKTLRHLIHFIKEGPAEGFTSGAYKETTYDGIKPTLEVWYEDATKAKKLVELATTWTGIKITQEVWKIYQSDGPPQTLLATITDSITYSGVKESSRTRTIA